MQAHEKSKRISQKKSKTKKEQSGPKELKLSFATSVGCISTFTLLVSTIILYDVIATSEENIDFDGLKNELHNEVHNQSEAVSSICNALNTVQKGEQGVTVLNFIGSTGVGKTFVANLIKKYFHSSYYESLGTRKPTGQKELSNTVITSGSVYKLIVLDDLDVGDVDDVLNFIKNLPEEGVILVICIFNIQETDDVLNYRINYENFDKIIDKFKKSEIAQNVARFYEFSAEEAGNWIVKQLLLKGVKPEFHLKIVKSLLESQNVKYHGLKGLSSKLRLEL